MKRKTQFFNEHGRSLSEHLGATWTLLIQAYDGTAASSVRRGRDNDRGWRDLFCLLLLLWWLLVMVVVVDLDSIFQIILRWGQIARIGRLGAAASGLTCWVCGVAHLWVTQLASVLLSWAGFFRLLLISSAHSRWCHWWIHIAVLLVHIIDRILVLLLLLLLGTIVQLGEQIGHWSSKALFLLRIGILCRHPHLVELFGKTLSLGLFDEPMLRLGPTWICKLDWFGLINIIGLPLVTVWVIRACLVYIAIVGVQIFVQIGRRGRRGWGGGWNRYRFRVCRHHHKFSLNTQLFSFLTQFLLLLLNPFLIQYFFY